MKKQGKKKKLKKIVPKKVKTEVEFEYTRLLDNIGQDESFLETIDTLIAKVDTYSLMVGEDLFTHPQSENLAKLCGLIDKYTDFSLVIIPSQTNTLGVSLLCDIEENIDGFTVGYNEKADFQLSALGDGDLDIPALNQKKEHLLILIKK